MDTKRTQVGWGFWLWWVLANIKGFAVGVAVGRDASWVAALDEWY